MALFDFIEHINLFLHSYKAENLLNVEKFSVEALQKSKD